MKASDALNSSKKILKNTVNGEQDALELLSIASQISKAVLLTNCNISSEVYNNYIALVKRRASGEPMDSIIGYTPFNGIKVLFNKHTLTPRKETELLANMAVKEIQNSTVKSNKSIRVLDLCCGSGCIGVSIAKHTNADVTCADISDYALAHTKQTAELNEAKVHIKKSDMLKNITGKYNILACNPPYIDKHDMHELEADVKNFDPKLALYGGEDGMRFYKYLAKHAHLNLTADGIIFLELDAKNAYAIKELFEHFPKVQLVKDYYNKNRYLIVHLKK